MNRTRRLDLDAPWLRRLRDSLTYPLQGSALAACCIFVLGMLVAGLLPSILSLIVSVLTWVAVYVFALSCLRHSADGFADPPEVNLEDSTGAAVVLFLLQILAMLATWLAWRIWHDAFVVPLILSLSMPVLMLSFAFGDYGFQAFNPLRWARLVAGMGIAYLLAAGLCLVQFLVWVMAIKYGSGILANMLWMAAVGYAILLCFHGLGRLAYRHHQALGHQPAADELEDERGDDADQQLLTHVRSLRAAGQQNEALELLDSRLGEAAAPWTLHAQYRQMAWATGNQQAALDKSPACLACLLQEKDWRRALAVVKQNQEFDPNYLPDELAVTGELAEQAAQMGMPRLALKLARGYVNTWPRDHDAPRYGLLAAQLLAEPLERPVEAGVLASKLLIAFPNCPQIAEIQSLLEAVKTPRKLSS